MPTYEYECPSGHAFEKFQKMTDKPRAKCPVCGKPAVRKISGGAGLVFKGSGFYITDYARASSEGSKSKKDSGEKSESKSEKTESAGKTEKVEKKTEKKEKKASSD